MNKLENINVRKRNGKLESFDIEKINQILNWATEGIKDVSASDIVLKATFNIDDKVNTKQLHQLLIDASLNCFTPETPNYQWVASRLLNFALRKEVWGGVNPPKLKDFLANVVKEKVYDSIILKDYSVDEINKLDEYISHDRDFNFSYAGIRQLCDKYLVQNRKTKKIYETPQFAYMAIAMTIFRSYAKDIRMQYVKRAYDAFSKLKINLPTPQLAGIRTPLRAYSSCCLIDVGDSMDSILASLSAVGKATSQRYGIGINFGRIRSINSEIRKGEVLHTGKIPFLKTFEAMTKSCQQNGIRGGGATVNIPFWDYEIEDVMVLKNNGGTEDNRVRKLDYVIQFSKLFWQRVQKDEWITLFSADQVRDLYDAFGYPEFDDLYLKYEGDVMLAPMRKKIKARELASLFVKERTETGRIYTLNVDHVQAHGAWDIKAEMTNLCVEITHPTKPLRYLDDPEGEIGVCVLAATNMVEIQDEKDLENVCDIIVRILDEVIDHQDYFCPAAENFTKNRRSLGIGYTNMAAWLAKNGYKYTDVETPNFVAAFAEQQQYYLLKASMNLAKEKGACNKFGDTKYSKGILPIDTYKKDIDAFVTQPLAMDWESLRKDILENGLRHSTLSAIMPCESSSVVQNATNGIEPPRDAMSYKKSKAGSVPMLVPGWNKWKKHYQMAYDIKDNKSILNVVAALVKFLDMSVSTNVYYKYTDYPDGKLPDIDVLKDIMYAYKVGVPALYYSNTNDESDQNDQQEDCAGGACSI